MKTIANTKWKQENGWAGGSVEFSTSQDGRVNYRYQIFGSGVAVVSSEDGWVQLEGQNLRFSTHQYAYDQRCDVFLSPTNPADRLVRDAPPQVNLHLDEKKTWARIHQDLQSTDPVVIREALYRAVGFNQAAVLKETLPGLPSLLQHPDPDVRMYAVWAAGNKLTSVPTILAGLKILLAAEPEKVREQAKLAAERLYPDLQTLAGSENAQTRRAAEQLLADDAVGVEKKLVIKDFQVSLRENRLKLWITVSNLMSPTLMRVTAVRRQYVARTQTEEIKLTFDYDNPGLADKPPAYNEVFVKTPPLQHVNLTLVKNGSVSIQDKPIWP
jgi:hypothetical protein